MPSHHTEWILLGLFVVAGLWWWNSQHEGCVGCKERFAEMVGPLPGTGWGTGNSPADPAYQY